MWYYTSQFKSVTSHPALYISGLINNANAAYANSNINLRLKTKCVEQLPDSFVEGDSVGTLLEDLVNVKGNEAKSVAGNHWLRLSPSVALLRGQVWSSLGIRCQQQQLVD